MTLPTGRTAIVAILMMAVAACTPADVVRNAPADAGVTRSVDAPYDKVTAATLDTLIALKVSIVIDDRISSLHIQVAKQQTALSWGEIGRIIIERRAAPPTPVRVLWAKRMQVQVTGTDQEEFAGALFKAIDERLARR